MNVIYKYELHVTDTQTIEIPKSAEMLCVQMQRGNPCLWVLVDPEYIKEKVNIRIFGTGNPIHESNSLEYIDTFQEGALVFHVFKERG